MGGTDSVLSQQDARHLLRRTGFGAPPAQVSALQGRTRGDVVAELLDFKPTRFKPNGSTIQRAHDRWVKYMLSKSLPASRSGRQHALQEKLVLFWHNHFATSYDKVGDVGRMGQQNQLIRENCKGNWKTFLQAMNKNPAMMYYLDTVQNHRHDANENYGRELQELFTLGVFDLQGAANYTQSDVHTIARAFTGWSYDNHDVATFNSGDHSLIADHKDGGPKVIYATTGGFGSQGANIAQNGEGAQEIDQVIEIILQHKDTAQKSTAARHIGRELFEFFCYANPDPAVLDEIIYNSNFDGGNSTQDHPTAWDISSFLSELFVHDEFYATSVSPDPTTGEFPAGAKKSIKWPVDFVVSTMRALNMRFKTSETVVFGGSERPIQSRLSDMGQLLLEPPSVFGWGLEENWITSFTILARYRFARDVIQARGDTSNSKVYFRPNAVLDFNTLDAITQNAGPIVDAASDALGITDQIPDASRTALMTYLTDPNPVTSHFDLTNSSSVDKKINGLFLLLLESPASHVF